ncbi:helix-turn-helix transcriptional regulator [Saccharopolyspora gregorii]|uniref:Helix-turn-helix transcriptional regulator n=2 Tax=Saccharopolyspora gregorii TaxID=33914 RepID=A0ABP6RV28_9PSEU
MRARDIAARLRCGQGKIAHMESMRNAISGPDLEIMLPFLGVPAERIDWYLRLAEVAEQKGWWDGNQAIPEWFSLYVGLEWGASEIREWDLGFVPGILQTRGYADAVLRDGSSAPKSHLEKQAEARLRRRDVLARDGERLALHAIIDESALRREVGSQEVMFEQVEELAKLCTTPQVTLQVMALGGGPHRGQLGSFHLVDFANADDPGVVYVENQSGGSCLEEPDVVEVFRHVFDELTMKALSISETEAFLRRLAKDFA